MKKQLLPDACFLVVEREPEALKEAVRGILEEFAISPEAVLQAVSYGEAMEKFDARRSQIIGIGIAECVDVPNSYDAEWFVTWLRIEKFKHPIIGVSPSPNMGKFMVEDGCTASCKSWSTLGQRFAENLCGQ